MGKKEGAVLIVKEVLRRGIAYAEDDGQGQKGGPTGYLAWKMMVSVLLILLFSLVAIAFCFLWLSKKILMKDKKQSNERCLLYCSSLIF
ncbi:hypothetical protein JRO89_XS13G0210200 [Xanthoceras sorbifolium]|uniref:Uncharacterized protein n=1 Tax=Xanthoceras sorbifolium TaxID=99658 RepID=A0ABQ8H9C6_9ROSI|nr:hypothetical protein JRO89_XS13G0210200 [Xanthoceras sorbifolium]